MGGAVIDWETVREAVSEFLDMSPAERSGYYDEFFEDWDLSAEDEAAFWEIYDSEA